MGKIGFIPPPLHFVSVSLKTAGLYVCLCVSSLSFSLTIVENLVSHQKNARQGRGGKSMQFDASCFSVVIMVSHYFLSRILMAEGSSEVDKAAEVENSFGVIIKPES